MQKLVQQHQISGRSLQECNRLYFQTLLEIIICDRQKYINKEHTSRTSCLSWLTAGLQGSTLTGANSSPTYGTSWRHGRSIKCFYCFNPELLSRYTPDFDNETGQVIRKGEGHMEKNISESHKPWQWIQSSRTFQIPSQRSQDERTGVNSKSDFTIFFPNF